MASNVISTGFMTRGAMIVSNNANDPAGSMQMFHQMIQQNNGLGEAEVDEPQCLPPIGQRIFW